MYNIFRLTTNSAIYFGQIVLIAIYTFQSSVIFAQDKVISQITSTYDSNQARFHTQYRGLQLNGVGSVQKIEADMLGIGEEFMVTINSNGSNLVCSTKNITAASKLRKGEQINFSGVIDDVLLGYLLLNNCSFNNLSIINRAGDEPTSNKKSFSQEINNNQRNTANDKNLSLIFPIKDMEELLENTEETINYLENRGWKERKFGCNTLNLHYICFINKGTQIDLEIINTGPMVGKIKNTEIYNFNSGDSFWKQINDAADLTRIYINKKFILQSQKLINFEILTEMPIPSPEGRSYITKYLLDCDTKSIKDIELNSYPESLGKGARNPINIPHNRLKYYRSNSKEIEELIENGCDFKELEKSNNKKYSNLEKKLSIVRKFYEALSDGNGGKAITFIVPEKRNKGNFQEYKINSFYGNMKKKLKIFEIKPLDSSTMQVTFEYTVNENKCNGRSVVKIKETSPSQPYIENITSNC